MITEILTPGDPEPPQTLGLEACQQPQENDVAKAMRALRQAEVDVECAITALSSAEEKLVKAKHDLEQAEYDRLNKLFVSACTTAGFWPSCGFQKVLLDQPVDVFLAEAKRELRIPDVTGWVARVGDRILKIDQSYRANGLAACSEVTIDWGPEHGGGGANA